MYTDKTNDKKLNKLINVFATNICLTRKVKKNKAMTPATAEHKTETKNSELLIGTQKEHSLHFIEDGSCIFTKIKSYNLNLLLHFEHFINHSQISSEELEPERISPITSFSRPICVYPTPALIPRFKSSEI